MFSKKLQVLFLAAQCFFAPCALADAPHWEFAGWYGGGCYPDVVFDPQVSGRVYLVSDVAGVWRSDDSGESWVTSSQGLGNFKGAFAAVAPSDSNVVYVGTSEGLFYSKDAAKSWLSSNPLDGRIHFSRPKNYRSIAVSKTQPSSLIVGTQQGEVFYSEDFGVTWKILGDQRPFGKQSAITALAWLEDKKTVYVASHQGVAQYSFSDSHWTYYPNSPQEISDFWVFDGENPKIYAAGQNKMFYSLDGGWTWQTGDPIKKGILFRLLPLDDQGQTILAAWNQDWKGGVAISRDAGKTWQDWDKKMTKDEVLDPTRAWAGVRGKINALKQDPFHPDVFIRTDWWGVWKSVNGGVDWTEKIKGTANTISSDVLVAKNGDVYVATMDNGLLKSADGGKTYQTVFPKNEFKDEENGHVWRVVENSERQIFATSSPWVKDKEQVVKVLDNGNSYQVFDQGLPAPRPKKNTTWHEGYGRAFAADPVDPKKLYLGIDGDTGGFFISNDGGKSWKRSAGQPASLKIYNALAVHPKDPKRIVWGAMGKRGGVYLTEDGGENWKHVLKQLKIVYDAVISADGTIYAGGDLKGPVLYVSKDGGYHWKLLKRFQGAGTTEALCLLPSGGLAAGVLRPASRSGGRIYLMSSKTEEWQNITGDMPEGEGLAAMAYHPTEKALYAARFAGSVYKWKMES